MEFPPKTNAAKDTRQISMPEELLRFIQRDTYSLLIKGHAGSGKTTLALTILRALRTKDNFFYISTRISPKELFSYYSWLSDFTHRQSRSAGEAGNSDNIAIPTFEDARLDEPESLFERITNQLMDIKSPIIVIDSWDAIASFMDREGRLNNERVLQTWRERAGAKLIFISEHPDDTTLDFLVGGIVELKQRHHNNVRYREIYLLKLRGVRIGRPSYIYTLENGIFRSFSPYVPPKSRRVSGEKSSPKKPVEILSSDLIKSGYAVLDRALGGGFPRNGFVLLELDEHLSATVAMSVVTALISNFVSNGHPVLFQPFGKIEPKDIVGSLDDALPARKKGLLKILWPRNQPGLADNLIVQSERHPSSKAVIVRLRKSYPGKLVINVMGGDSLSIWKSEKQRNYISQDQMLSARACDLCIAPVSAADIERFEYFSGLADVHLRLLMINDTLFLQPLLPASTLYALEFDEHNMNIDAVV